MSEENPRGIAGGMRWHYQAMMSVIPEGALRRGALGMFIHYGELLDAEAQQADDDEYSPVDIEDEWHICPSLHEAMDIFLQYAFHGEYKTPGGLTAEETQKLYDAYADEEDGEPAGDVISKEEIERILRGLWAAPAADVAHDMLPSKDMLDSDNEDNEE